MANMEGSFEFVSGENFDEYLKALGISFMLRKTIGALKPDTIITKDGDTWTLKSVSTFKTTELSFKLGEEIEERTGDDRLMKTTFTVDGNKLIQSQKATAKDGVDSTITRVFDGDGFVAICEAGGVQAERKYKRKQ